MNVQEVFSKRFNIELERSELSKSEVADRIGVNKSTISRYSKGLITPNALALAGLCTLFGCSSDYLLGIESFDKQLTPNHSSLGKLNIPLAMLNQLSNQQISEITTFIEFYIQKNS